MDKNVYKPNDIAFFEVFFVDPITKKPIINEQEKSLEIKSYIKIVDGLGQLVYEQNDKGKW